MSATGPTIRETRAELATLRATLRLERTDLWELLVNARTDAEAGEAGVHDDPTAAALSYAHYNVTQADRALTTALEALRPLLDAEEDAR